MIDDFDLYKIHKVLLRLRTVFHQSSLLLYLVYFSVSLVSHELNMLLHFFKHT